MIEIPSFHTTTNRLPRAWGFRLTLACTAVLAIIAATASAAVAFPMCGY
jgi:hypothetical protein